MGRKTKAQKAIDILKTLNKTELQQVLDSIDIGHTVNTYADIEGLFDRLCPVCKSSHNVKTGTNRLGLTYYKCKDCGRRFNILSDTPLEKTPYELKAWVTILEKMLTYQSIDDAHTYLIDNGIVDSIDRSTVSAMMNKLRNCFIYMPLPVLEGNVQVDEKHFRESQKGTENPIDVLNLTGTATRKPHQRATASKYGTMGPEFSTICCAVDSSGHSVAKVVTMGHMTLDDFEDNIAIHYLPCY